MPIPWLVVLDAVAGVTSAAARGWKRRSPSEDLQQREESAVGGGLETRLAGVVVAALKEAFDRDHQRLELEREHIEAERQRAERTLQLELLRQTGDREVARLRLLAGVVVATWLGTLFFAVPLEGAGQVRIFVGLGWLLLLAALAASFVGQSRVGRDLAGIGDRSSAHDPLSSGPAGALAPWLLVAGLALVGLAVLVV